MPREKPSAEMAAWRREGAHMARANREDLRKLQSDRLKEFKHMQRTDPERARKVSRERLVSAGLIRPDGRPNPLYA